MVPGGVHGPGGAWSRGDVHGRGMGAGCAWSCGGVHGGDPPLPIRMATAASGTHPTGMHSCVNFGTATHETFFVCVNCYLTTCIGCGMYKLLFYFE